MILFSLQSACVDKPCDNNSTCQSGFTDQGYRCVCTTGFKGPRCKKGNPCHVKPVVSSCSLVSGRNRCNCCLNSNITVNISIFSIIIIVGLNAARFPFYQYFNVWYYFRFRALVLINLAITILLVKAVLLTKDIAVCVPLDSKVQGVRKVTPVMSNRS